MDSSIPFVSVRHLPAQASDHNSLLLDTTTPKSHLPKPFQFGKFWTKDPSYNEVIASTWNLTIVGNSSFILVQKLKSTKVALRSGILFILGIFNNGSTPCHVNLMLFSNLSTLQITPLGNGLSKKLWMISISKKPGSLVRILTLYFFMSLLLSEEKELQLIFSTCP
jgi:hypothetical protein